MDFLRSIQTDLVWIVCFNWITLDLNSPPLHPPSTLSNEPVRNNKHKYRNHNSRPINHCSAMAMKNVSLKINRIHFGNFANESPVFCKVFVFAFQLNGRTRKKDAGKYVTLHKNASTRAKKADRLPHSQSVVERNAANTYANHAPQF